MPTKTEIELEEARRLLGLGSRASIAQIKAAFRRLVKQYHPDRAEDREEVQERMRQLNRAYKILLEHCESYPIPLDGRASEEGFEDYAERFFGNWFKGGK